MRYVVILAGLFLLIPENSRASESSSIQFDGTSVTEKVIEVITTVSALDPSLADDSIVNAVLEAVTGASDAEYFNTSVDCRERCEDISGWVELYLACSRSCRLVYPAQ